MANAKEWGLPVGTRPSLGDGLTLPVGMKSGGGLQNAGAENECIKTKVQAKEVDYVSKRLKFMSSDL